MQKKYSFSTLRVENHMLKGLHLRL